MKYFGRTKILIPWFDEQGMKQRSLITIDGEIDKRALMRGIHQFIKKNFNKIVSNTWILKNCPIINQHDSKLTMVSNPDAIGRQFSAEVNEWLNKLEAEADAIETRTGSTDTLDNIDFSGQPLCAMPDKDYS